MPDPVTTEQPTPEDGPRSAGCAPKRTDTLDTIIAHSAGGGVVSGHPDSDEIKQLIMDQAPVWERSSSTPVRGSSSA